VRRSVGGKVSRRGKSARLVGRRKGREKGTEKGKGKREGGRRMEETTNSKRPSFVAVDATRRPFARRTHGLSIRPISVSKKR